MVARFGLVGFERLLKISLAIGIIGFLLVGLVDVIVERNLEGKEINVERIVENSPEVLSVVHRMEVLLSRSSFRNWSGVDS